MVTSITSSKAVDASSSQDSSAQIAALQRQLAAALKELLASQQGAPGKATEQQQKQIAHRIVTFQAQIAALQASSAQKGSANAATAAINAAASQGAQEGTQERVPGSGATLGTIIDTQA